MVLDNFWQATKLVGEKSAMIAASKHSENGPTF